MSRQTVAKPEPKRKVGVQPVAERADSILIVGVGSSFAGEAIELAEAHGRRIAALVTNIALPHEDARRWRYPLCDLTELPDELRELPPRD